MLNCVGLLLLLSSTVFAASPTRRDVEKLVTHVAKAQSVRIQKYSLPTATLALLSLRRSTKELKDGHDANALISASIEVHATRTHAATPIVLTSNDINAGLAKLNGSKR